MSQFFYDAIIPTKLQILEAVDTLLDKAEAFAEAHGIAPADLIDARLAPDMLPFGYQIKKCAENSMGAVVGLRTGVALVNEDPWPTNFKGLHALIRSAIDALNAIDPVAFQEFSDGDTMFKVGKVEIPFTAPDFMLSFTQPNFYFHATIAYAILRMRGADIGKSDFLGQFRAKRPAPAV